MKSPLTKERAIKEILRPPNFHICKIDKFKDKRFHRYSNKYFWKKK